MKQLSAVAAAGALVLALSACAGTAPEAVSSLSMPAEPVEASQPSRSTPEAPAPRPSGRAAPAGAAMADCLVVAAGVSSVLLAPLSFEGSGDPGTMARLEEQLRHLHGKAPDELKPHFATVADAAESGPDGSGRFDEPAFREALKPVQGWLNDHCGDPVE